MKTTTLLERLCRMAAILVCAACAYACSEDEPAATDTPQPDPDQGEVSFVIHHEGGSGAGTADSPAEVSDGDTLTMVISQKSSYTDTDGTVHSCEPEATISLNAVRDTVYAQNEGLLTRLEEGSDVDSSTIGTDPVTHLMEQVFHIGSQQIRFHLGYEVYTYLNKANQAVEMPYVKLNQANFGSASSDESEPEQTKATARISQPVVTLTPLRQTKAIVSDTTLYNVNVQFHLEVESQNVKAKTRQTLAFSVNYVGAVVSSMEVPDEDNGTVSCQISAEGGSGEGTSGSPYVVTAGNALKLTIGQTSTYTDMDWSEFTCSPRATISVYADVDKVYAESLEQLTRLVGDDATTDVDGENPKVYTIGQAFTVGGQSIHFDMDYEVYPYTTQAGQEIEMPHLKINQASYQGAQTSGAAAQYAVKSSRAVVSATPQTRAIVSDTAWYDVKVKFNVELEIVNTAEPTSHELVFSVNYTGGVITQVEEPELVRVEYRTDYVWEEAHHNLPLLYYTTVYRDRYYSNGEVITDTFRDSGHMVSLAPVRLPDDARHHTNNYGVEIVLSDITIEEDNDSITIVHGSAQIADPTTVFAKSLSTDTEDDAGNWGDYVVSKLYDVPNLYIPADGVPSNGGWASDSRASGWYFSDCRFMKSYVAKFKALDNEGDVSEWTLCNYLITIAAYDQFLVIDGRRIDFLAYRPEYHFNMLTDTIDNGIRQTYECKFNYMGRNFYVAVINDITSL